jgi:hypothetical protein
MARSLPAWDRFVFTFGQGAFLDARATCASGLTGEGFFNLLARDDSGNAPGYPEAEKTLRPSKVVGLRGFAARATDSGTKTPISADHVAEVNERYFEAFAALLSAMASALHSAKSSERDERSMCASVVKSVTTSSSMRIRSPRSDFATTYLGRLAEKVLDANELRRFSRIAQNACWLYAVAFQNARCLPIAWLTELAFG